MPVVWNEREDFRRNSVDRCGCVLPGPNEAENFERVLLENTELEYDACQSQRRRTSYLFTYLGVVWSHPNPANATFSHLISRVLPPQTYLVQRIVSRRNVLVARKCGDIEEPPLGMRVDMIVDDERIQSVPASTGV